MKIMNKIFKTILFLYYVLFFSTITSGRKTFLVKEHNRNVY